MRSFGMINPAFTVNGSEREELSARTRSRTLPSEDVRRARLILMLADGDSYTTIQLALRCNRSYISQWKQRFESGGLSALYSRHQGRAPSKNATKLEAKILARTQRKPADGSTHWSTRKLATELGIDHMRVGTGVGSEPVFNHTGSNTTFCPTIRNSKPRRPTLLGCM
jgi:transposase